MGYGYAAVYLMGIGTGVVMAFVFTAVGYCISQRYSESAYDED